MATEKTATRLCDKLVKIAESFTVHRYDNGYMFEINGRNTKGEYITAKILCVTMDQVAGLMREAGEMDLDS
jgi:hypothetical protein